MKVIVSKKAQIILKDESKSRLLLREIIKRELKNRSEKVFVSINTDNNTQYTLVEG